MNRCVVPSLFLSASLLGLSGCADNNVTPTSIVTSSGTNAASLYAVQGGNSILQFSLAASSTNLTPTTTITAPTGTQFYAVTTDSTGKIYVGATTTTGVGEVLVYASGSTGAATPTTTITGGTSTSTTTFGVPKSMHISSAGTLMILSSNGAGYSVATMPSTASGTVTPTTLLQGAATLMTSVNCATIDQAGKVYVTNYATTGSILEFAANATGNVPPTTTITTGTSDPYGVAADASGNVFTGLDSTTGGLGTIAVYAVGASGAATPTRTITGTTSTIAFVGGLRLDTNGNLYFINRVTAGTGYAFPFLEFTQSQSGNVAPALSIASTLVTSPAAEIAVR